MKRLNEKFTRVPVLKSSKVANWARDPFVKTGYTYNFGDMEALQEPLRGGRLHFAGEALPADADSVGYVHGAAQSGKAAAAKIVKNYCSAHPNECGDYDYDDYDDDAQGASGKRVDIG